VPTNAMTIHGLWPGLKSGKQLNTCTSGVKITDTGSSLFQNMRQYWPSFSGANTDFWEHEYNKHGYCMAEEYGWNSYESYFQFVIDLHFRTYRDLMKNCFSSTQTVSYNDMVNTIRSKIPTELDKSTADEEWKAMFITACNKKTKVCKDLKIMKSSDTNQYFVGSEAGAHPQNSKWEG
jgi:ribonuclease I